MSHRIARFPSLSECPAHSLAHDCAGEFWPTAKSRWFNLLPKWFQTRLVHRHVRKWLARYAGQWPLYTGLIGSLAVHRIEAYSSVGLLPDFRN